MSSHQETLIGDTQAAQGTAFQITGAQSSPHGLRGRFLSLLLGCQDYSVLSVRRTRLKIEKQQVQDGSS